MSSATGSSALYENWRHYADGKQGHGMSEVRLYTDARITGEIRNLGPFSLLNLVAQPSVRSRNPLVAGIVLRMCFHVPSDKNLAPMKDDFEHYHGGDIFDEVAALVSLFLGIRLKAGNVDRIFLDNDPLGRPIAFSHKPEPYLIVAERPQIPSLQRVGALGETSKLVALNGLQSLPYAKKADAVAFVKAARLYQQAIWIADVDPEFAWLLLVACVETVAVQWDQKGGAHRERLRDGIPKVASFLESRLAEADFVQVAKLLAQFTGVVRKFVTFVRCFAPGPPDHRPLGWRRFDYDPERIEAAAKIIYGHRSKYLHSGTAIPMPMCEAPTILFPQEGDSYGEIPLGLAVQSKGAQWTNSSTPMLLHTFEHIARGTVLNWWRSLPASS